MMRFFLTCVLLASICIVGIVTIGKFTSDSSSSVSGSTTSPVQPDNQGGKENGDGKEVAGPMPASSSDNRPVVVIPVPAHVGAPQSITIPGGRVMPLEKQEVPSERDGKLVLLATPVEPGEWVPKSRLIEIEVPVLAIKVTNPLEEIKDEEKIEDPTDPRQRYRRPRKSDSLAPGTTAIVRRKMQFRKLAQDDLVKKDQILGVINPDLALEDVAVKQSKVQQADLDHKAAEAMVEEYYRRLVAYKKAERAISKDDLGATEASYDKARNEALAKQAAIGQSQRELSAAWTTLDMYMIKASIPGRIRHIYKNTGDAVKALDQVMQIQNSVELKVEAQIDVADALRLRSRLKQAEKHLNEAQAIATKKKAGNAQAIQDYINKANELVACKVEVSQPAPPKAVLSGHLQEVTAVAVTRGPSPKIISGSEEGWVRIWERVPGEDRWQERTWMKHGAPIRALACTTSAKAKHNILVTATSSGMVRLFNLDDLKSSEKRLVDGHQGAVTAVAINADATQFATAGDRTICVWSAEDGSLITRKKAAHPQPITSLVFTPEGKLISVARDRKIIIWKTPEQDTALEQAEDPIGGRSGEVGSLGLDPTGKRILFDEGRELQMLNLATRRSEGAVVNPGTANSFSILAQFSPDGKSILTNGNGPGRLQLWRTPVGKPYGAEVRQYVWTTGTVNCAAFDPNGAFVVTGTSDNRVLVWELPSKEEAEKPLDARLTYVEESLDTGLQRVTIRATLDNPGWVMSGAQASIILPSLPGK